MRAVSWVAGSSVKSFLAPVDGWHPCQPNDRLAGAACLKALTADNLLSPWKSWLPLLLIVGGLLFIVGGGLVVFWILRHLGRSEDDPQSHEGEPVRNGESASAPWTPLAEGTLLQAGRFVVKRLHDQRGDAMLYEVTDLETDGYCQFCGSPLPDRDIARCPSCDVVVRSEGSTSLIAKETLDPDAFALSEKLSAFKIRHPAVVMPLAVFSEAFDGQPRYYHIVPDVGLRISTELDPPQPVDRVLRWGVVLADGLAALHRHGVAFREITSEAILVGEAEARWICCWPGILINGERESDVDRSFASDVRGLGRWMLLQATGNTSLGSELSLPESLSGLLTDVLTAPYPISAQQLAEQLGQVRRDSVAQEDARLCVGAASDTGRKRDLNEDSLWVADYQDAFSSLGIGVGGFGVADGVGGHAAGDVASQLTVDVLRQYGDELRSAGERAELPDARAWLERAAEAANRRVYEERQAVSSDMGSTLVMAVFIGNEFAVLNVGDSRAYRLGLQGIQQITVDHTLVQRLVSIGQITRDEAKMHPRRNVIYRVIGGQADLACDVFEGKLAAREALLLCSDGLTDMLTDRVLWQIWRESPSPQAACDRMVVEANQVGGHDNITAILIQVITTQNGDPLC